MKKWLLMEHAEFFLKLCPDERIIRKLMPLLYVLADTVTDLVRSLDH